MTSALHVHADSGRRLPCTRGILGSEDRPNGAVARLLSAWSPNHAHFGPRTSSIPNHHSRSRERSKFFSAGCNATRMFDALLNRQFRGRRLPHPVLHEATEP